MRWTEHVARTAERRYAYTVMVRRPEGKRPLGTLRRRCGDNIKMDLQEVRWRNMDWFDLAQGWNRKWALVNAVMNLWVP